MTAFLARSKVFASGTAPKVVFGRVI